MVTQTMYELNHTYLVVSGDEVDRTENYRYKMLSANNIKGILPLEIRMINGEKRIYIDVTGKESLLRYFENRVADKYEIKGLFDAIYIISGEMSKFLIGETDVIMRPEMMFKNLVTGEFEFICIPLVEDGIPMNEGMKSLMQFLIKHLDNGNEKLVSAIYTIYEMFITGLTKFSVAYEFFVEEVRDEEEQESSEKEEIAENRFNVYFPSLKEITALSMCTVGLVLIGYNIYLSMLL